ncbi:MULTISPECIES: GlxA family transcriptional regulator [Catenuloplanes]|uniref:Transcriptional regulator GlxA family with amidase domain n=1 Tax=Catenuloplanes niger TaxID=587534 RepID=A0AAE3ZKT1_9ACTN|nr:helix-turn-helix domain-containing protein [Catenuloplanes niger]MDR7320762.1 transcriptional regulator GlxA family with amidase domain [Catenuloplanes niger]
MSAFSRVVAYAPPGVTGLGLGVVTGVFAANGVFDLRPGLPVFDLTICARRTGVLRTDSGVPLHIDRDLDAFGTAELIMVLPGTGFRQDRDDDLLNALRAAHRRGAIVAGHCVGSFLLAAAGLLDGLDATTHWQYADEMAAAYPEVTVRRDALYIDHGQVSTGAGATAGFDLSLHLLRTHHGAAVANRIARNLVTPPHRAGGQAQYLDTPVPPGGDDSLDEVLGWARENLHRRLSVDQLAARAMTSRRTFLRRFRRATGTSPQAWLTTQRLHNAEELLETTELPVEQIAHRVGYASAAALRDQFVQHRGVPPRDYRHTFRHHRP